MAGKAHDRLGPSLHHEQLESVNKAPLETAAKLQHAMHLPGRAPWKRCLVTIKRGSAEISIEFDYEGNRWVPDTKDPEGFALGLKPSSRG